MYKFQFKRLIDLLVSIAMLLILSPIILLVAICLCILNHGKPFFLQDRPGKDGIIFKIIKFKTMTDKRGIDGEWLPDAQRITPFGSFVRKTSLDELPQLINVLKGDMSLIGPRPLLPEYLVLYSKEQARRHELRPGITGWAQVNGRNAISWPEKFKYDVWYVNNVSFALDMKIIYLTIKKVVVRDGVNSSASVTMEKFKG